MNACFRVAISVSVLVGGAWSVAHGQRGTHSAQMRRIAANRDTVARVTRDLLAEAGFTLVDRPSAAAVGRARMAYGSVPCAHVRAASGDLVLRVDLNPRGSLAGHDTTVVMVSFPETRAVLEARRAEGVSLFESDCLQKFVTQLTDSIEARALSIMRSER